MKNTLWLAVGLIFLSTNVRAVSVNYLAQIKNEQTRYQRPEDLLEMVPLVNSIPRSFRIWDNMHLKLEGQELLLSHQGSRKEPAAKSHDCSFTFSVASPLGGSLSSRIDVPLFQSTAGQWSTLSFNSSGDYMLRLGRESVDHTTMRLMAHARF